jgi:hypothetical protein
VLLCTRLNHFPYFFSSFYLLHHLPTITLISHQTFFFLISTQSSPILLPHCLSFFFTSFFYFLQKAVFSLQLPSLHHFFCLPSDKLQLIFASSLSSLYCISSLIIFFFFFFFFFFSFPHCNSLLFFFFFFFFFFSH